MYKKQVSVLKKDKEFEMNIRLSEKFIKNVNVKAQKEPTVQMLMLIGKIGMKKA